MKAGALCMGYGGLELGLSQVLDLDLAWYSEIDPHACKVLEARFPGVPNLGDLTAVDWQRVEPVDVVSAGFPCQPVSHAGKRKGIEDDRWLWDDIAAAVGRMGTRPKYLLFENVAGLLSANDGDAFRRVAHDLASLGFDAEWCSIRASDVGAPHRRERVFILAAYPAGVGRHEGRAESARIKGGLDAPVGRASPDAAGVQDWARFTGVIRRWERITRPAPPALADGRYNARFTEWVMGLPDGWVTDLLPRNRAIDVLGNGVVPQQAAAAFAHLFSRLDVEVVA